MSLLILLLAGCASRIQEPPEPPEPTCPPATVVPDGNVFTRVSEAWGLSDVRGNRLTTADFDGDGRPDLLVSPGAATVRNDLAAGEQHNYLLRNTGDGFVDVTAGSGITASRDGSDDRAFQVAAWGDVDNDGDLDLFTGVHLDRNSEEPPVGPHEVLLNDGAGTFALAPPSDVRFSSAISGASFVDVDRDGNLDLWITGWYARYGELSGEEDRLLLGHGDGTFTDVTEARGLSLDEGEELEDFLGGEARRPSFGATATDLDGDGDADLLSSAYGRQWNLHWRNDGERFVEIGRESGVAGDALTDHADNQFYRCWCEANGCDPSPGEPETDRCAQFADYWSAGSDDHPFRLNGNTFTIASGDLDNDGDIDLVTSEIVHWHIGGSSDPSQILLNDGTGAFTRPGNDVTGLVRPREGHWNEGDLQVSLVDLDNDGWKDVLWSTSDYPDQHMWWFRQVAPLRFEAVETAGLDHARASGIAVADFDGDGDLDVVTGSSTMRGGPWKEAEVHLLRNDLPPGNHVRLKLVGTQANRTAIGARVTVDGGDLVQTFEVSGGYGHMGVQHTTGVHVGLGDACLIDAIEVRWPDARSSVDRWTDVPANRTLVLRQGGELRTE